jgi:DNA-directed RNA polymerase specialized sigma24 family protein
MGFNYGREFKNFNAKWEVLQKEYEAAGMSAADIDEMRKFDWEDLKSERRFRTHNQPLEGFSFSDGDTAGEDQSPLLERHPEEFSVRQPEIREWGRYDWVEDIDTPELAHRVKSLSAADLELLTMMVTDGLSRADLSRKLGVSRAAITKRVNRIKKILKEVCPQG